GAPAREGTVPSRSTRDPIPRAAGRTRPRLADRLAPASGALDPANHPGRHPAVPPGLRARSAPVAGEVLDHAHPGHPSHPDGPLAPWLRPRILRDGLDEDAHRS